MGLAGSGGVVAAPNSTIRFAAFRCFLPKVMMIKPTNNEKLEIADEYRGEKSYARKPLEAILSAAAVPFTPQSQAI